MQEFLPSRTALRVALRRAAHQVYDAKPLVFEDPFALSILGSTYQDELRRTPQRGDRPHSKALRAWLVGRSRYAEDRLAEAVPKGVTQYVLLGAGLDTFLLRNRHPGLHVFEVDHPATQAWKRVLLQQGGLPFPANSTLVPVDFEQQTLALELERMGFDSGKKTLFAWLGVVPYLTLSAFRATLSFVTAAPAGSGLVFDYMQPREALPPRERLEYDSLASRVRLAGEPFQLFFRVSEMAEWLRPFHEVEDVGRDELNVSYFSGRQDGLRLLGTAGRLVSAVL